MTWNQSESNFIRNQIAEPRALSSNIHILWLTRTHAHKPIRKFWFNLHKCVCVRIRMEDAFVIDISFIQIYRLNCFVLASTTETLQAIFVPIRFLSGGGGWLGEGGTARSKCLNFLSMFSLGKTFSTHHHIKLYYYLSSSLSASTDACSAYSSSYQEYFDGYTYSIDDSTTTYRAIIGECVEKHAPQQLWTHIKRCFDGGMLGELLPFFLCVAFSFGYDDICIYKSCTQSARYMCVNK